MSLLHSPRITTDGLVYHLDAGNLKSVSTSTNRNLMLDPESFDSNNWIKVQTTVIPNAALAPDGTMTADKIVGNLNATSRRGVYRSIALQAGCTYTFSVYMKAAGHIYAAMWADNYYTHPSPYYGANGLLNLSTGTSSDTTHATITAVGDGWYRAQVTFVQTVTGNHTFSITTGAPNGGAGTPNGDGINGTFLWGAQVERIGEVFPNPSLELNFQYSQILDSKITFTRASTATHVTSAGTVGTVAVNTPRYDFDVTNGIWRGMLIEPSATNRYTFSSDGIPATFSSTVQAADFNLATTIPPNSSGSVSNSTRLFSINTNTNIQHYMVSDTVAWTSTTWNTYSVYLKPNSGTIFPIITVEDGAGSGVYARFDLANSVVTTGTNGFGVFGVAGMETLGNSWKRCWVSGRGFNGARFGITSHNVNSGGGWYPSYVGTVGDSFYVWGIQLESSVTFKKPTSFIYSGSRSADAAVITGTNFSSWYNQSEGTILVDYWKTKETLYSGYLHPVNISDNTAANQIPFYNIDATNQITNFSVFTSGLQQTDYATATSNTGLNKAAQSYKKDQMLFAVNGVTVGADYSNTVPTVNRMNIGMDVALGAHLNDCVSRIVYWPYALPANTISSATNLWSAATTITNILPTAYYSTSSNLLANTWVDLTGTQRNTNLTQVEVLVVGGGGSGAATGAGGGAGGLVYNAAFPVSSGTSYTVTVGAGALRGLYYLGGSGSSNLYQGNNGSNSVFGSITAFGGGGGRFHGDTSNGNTGGSGGGAAILTVGTPGNGGQSLAGQGFPGGNGFFDVGWVGTHAGGGGAGGPGANGGNTQGAGNGGIGRAYDISGTLTYYAGGGGGGEVNGTFVGAGGLGGGGSGFKDNAGTNGAPNTGGGGGGGGYGTNAGPSLYTDGGDGGSGIVIVRYPLPVRATGGAISIVNNQVIHTFTSGTSNFVVENSETRFLGTPAYYSQDQSIIFNGVDTYMTAPISDSFLNAGSWTMSAWIKLSAAYKGNDNPIFSHGSSASANNALHIVERNGTIYFGMYANDVGGSISIINNKWYNVSCTYDYTTKLKTIYVNGVFDAALGTVGYTGVGSNFMIGKLAYDSKFFNGRMGNIQIYSRVLSLAEVQQNFNALRGRYGV
jgi:hypothetical protein